MVCYLRLTGCGKKSLKDLELEIILAVEISVLGRIFSVSQELLNHSNWLNSERKCAFAIMRVY